MPSHLEQYGDKGIDSWSARYILLLRYYSGKGDQRCNKCIFATGGGVSVCLRTVAGFDWGGDWTKFAMAIGKALWGSKWYKTPRMGARAHE